jgi:hypothetical protein
MEQFELCAFSINGKNVICLCVCVRARACMCVHTWMLCIKKILIYCNIKLCIMPVHLTKITTVFMYL